MLPFSLIKMKKLVTLIAVTLFVVSGCSSTVTLGPQANKDAVVGATLSTTEAGVTLPLIKATTGTVESPTKKKK